MATAMFDVTCVFADGHERRTRTNKDGIELVGLLNPQTELCNPERMRQPEFRDYAGLIPGVDGYPAILLMEKPRYVEIVPVKAESYPV